MAAGKEVARSLIVIPARLASTRLPRKLLLRRTGKTLIQHTFEAAQTACLPCGVCVAADHEEIAAAVRDFGGEVRLTSPDCPSGTDRVAEIASRVPEIDIFVNVQGDEPEIAGASIDAAIAMLVARPDLTMSTLATPIRQQSRLLDPSCVKVVFDQHRRALYFSRSPIPAARQWSDELLRHEPPLFYQHIGLYAYRRAFLLQLAGLPPSEKEDLEKLEQLRVLDAGYSIAVAVVPHAATGIDTADDYEAFVARYAARTRSEAA